MRERKVPNRKWFFWFPNSVLHVDERTLFITLEPQFLPACDHLHLQIFVQPPAAPASL